MTPPALTTDDVLSAWVSWLGAQAAPLTRPAYKHGPPEPYDGAYPYVAVAPQDQATTRIAGGEVQERGLYTIFYVDQIGAGYQLLADLMTAATLYADALERALAAERLAAPGQGALGGAVEWAGEGQGVTKGFTDRREVDDQDNFRTYALPITVDVLCFSKDG